MLKLKQSNADCAELVANAMSATDIIFEISKRRSKGNTSTEDNENVNIKHDSARNVVKSSIVNNSKVGQDKHSSQCQQSTEMSTKHNRGDRNDNRVSVNADQLFEVIEKKQQRQILRTHGS